MDEKKKPFENLKGNTELFNEKIAGFIFGAALEDGKVGMMVNGKLDLADRILFLTGVVEAMLGVELPKWPLKLDDDQKNGYLKFLAMAFGSIAELVGDEEKFLAYVKSKIKAQEEKKADKEEDDAEKKFSA